MLLSSLVFALTLQAPLWKVHPAGEVATFLAPGVMKESKLPDDSYFKGQQEWVAIRGRKSFSFFVSQDKDSDATPSETLAKGLHSFGPAVQSITSLKDITVSGWPAIAFRMDADFGIMEGRIVAFNHKMVMAFASYPPAGPGKPGEIDTFLGSVRIKNSGPMVKPGPTMSRFALADSGLSLLLPHMPKSEAISPSSDPDSSVMHRFQAVHGLRVFMAMYMDYPASAPDPDENELADAERGITADLVAGMKATVDSQKPGPIGKYSALITTFHMQGAAGKIAVFSLGRRFIALVFAAPKVYANPEVENAFLNSLESDK